MTTIEKRSDLSYKEFIAEYQNTGKPVILENATNVWKSNLIFTPEFFKEKFGDRKAWYGTKDNVLTISDMIDRTAKSTKEHPSPYPVKFDIFTQLPELLDYMDPLHLNLAQPNWLNSRMLKNKMGHAMDLHIGGAGNHYPVHKDSYDVHAWLIQLYGEKEVIVFPNGQEEFLYPGVGGMKESRSPIDISDPDYDKYPKFKHATPIRVLLKAGEVMYIPSGVWHTTMAYGQNISTIIDQVNASNYKAWRRDVYVYKKYHNKNRAVLDYIAATLIGNLCKLQEYAGKQY